ncbi:acyltransferase [Verrucomicrobiaceae bacterium R5-34]|nr:acyltransferase [Verrucomicrobiaceae bacterium R5-34]
MLRAFGILAILAHNFLHWLDGNPGENEFNFHASRGEDFLSGLSNSPEDAVRLIASFFFHYGVQIFVFLSSYGLCRKYRNHIPRYFGFCKQRLLALYPSILIAAAGYLIYESIQLGPATVFQTHGLHLLGQTTGLSTFVADNVYLPIGPWWFISLILQSYLITPPLIRLVRKAPRKAPICLITLSLVLEYTLAKSMEHHLGININHTVLGHLDVLALGMMFAYQPPKIIPAWLSLSCLAVVVLGNFVAWLWPLTFIAVTLMTLVIFRNLLTSIDEGSWLGRALALTGQLSLMLFLTNGYLRQPLVKITNHYDHPLIHLAFLALFCLSTFCVSLLLSLMLKMLQAQYRKRTSRQSIT